MRKLHRIMLLSQATLLSICLASCDKAYDLSKELNTDITIGTKFTVPIGETVPIYLNRMIKTSNSLTVNNQGIYEITANGGINSHINPVNPVSLTGFDPILKEVKIQIADFYNNKIRNANYDFNTEFSSTAAYNIDVKLPKEVETLSYAELSSGNVSPITTTMRISVKDIFPQGIELMYLRDFSIEFPEIFKIQGQEGNIVKYNELIISRDKPYVSVDIKFESIKLTEAQQAKFITGTSGNKHLEIKTNLVVNSKLYVPVDPIKLDTREFYFTFAYNAPQIQITKVAGIFIPDANIDTKVALNDIPDFIKGENSNFSVNDISMNLELNNPINMQLSTELIITPWNDKLNIIAGSSVNVKLDQIEGSAISRFIISNTPKSVPGYINIVNPNLTTLLTKVPDSYKITSNKITAKNVNPTQNFPLGKAFDLNGDYAIKVPFSFNNLDIVYTDSIDNLLSDLKDVTDKTKKVIVKAKAVSTLPTALDFNVKMLDANGKELSGIIVDLSKFKVAASVNEVESIGDIEFSITEKDDSNDLSLLEKIVYQADAKSLNGQKNITLKPTQYIVVKDIVVTVPNGIDVSF